MVTKMGLVQRYLNGYPEDVIDKVLHMVQNETLGAYLDSRYPDKSLISNDSELRVYVQDIKNRYLKKSAPLSKIIFDNKIHALKNALGTHTYVKRVQGSKVKSKNELRVSAIFKGAPQDFLNMIVVHELAHIKEKEHDKAFYKLCRHMLPEYHQIEFDCRLFLISREI
jgi:predicted metal-dependent hydrolase